MLEPYKIAIEGEPLLHEVMPVVMMFDDMLSGISQRMIDTMILYEGLGLSAPQCHLTIRMFVMQFQEDVISCINPEIIQSDEPIICSEGCLSFPNLILKIKRANEIIGKYFTEKGEIITKTFHGIESQCFQHEFDHLNGITFDKKVSNLVLNIAKRKRQKQRGR